MEVAVCVLPGRNRRKIGGSTAKGPALETMAADERVVSGSLGPPASGSPLPEGPRSRAPPAPAAPAAAEPSATCFRRRRIRNKSRSRIRARPATPPTTPPTTGAVGGAEDAAALGVGDGLSVAVAEGVAKPPPPPATTGVVEVEKVVDAKDDDYEDEVVENIEDVEDVEDMIDVEFKDDEVAVEVEVELDDVDTREVLLEEVGSKDDSVLEGIEDVEFWDDERRFVLTGALLGSSLVLVKFTDDGVASDGVSVLGGGGDVMTACELGIGRGSDSGGEEVGLAFEPAGDLDGSKKCAVSVAIGGMVSVTAAGGIESTRPGSAGTIV